MKKFLPDLVAILAFVLISFVYFFPADIEGRILFQHDTAAGVGAGQEALQYYEETGERTRWTNSIFGGMPTYQISPSYDSTRPLSWIQQAYRLFLPGSIYLTFIMMLGFYILLRAFGIPAWYAGLGGIIWAFSSYFFILISAGHIWKFITLAYIPPTIAGMVLAYRGKLLAGGVVTALFTALQIVANHVQMSYYFLFVMLFIAIAYGVQAVQNRTVPQFLKATGVLLLAGMVGVAVNMSNLYHTYTYSKETMRGKSELVQTGDAARQTSSGLDRDYITNWSYGIGETLTLLVPNFKGGSSGAAIAQSETAMKKANPMYAGLYSSLPQYFGEQPGTSGPVYVGAFVLFLFILGCFVVKGPMKWALIVATVFSILLSWGKNFMPLTDLFIDYMPMYNKFRAVSSILVIAEFAIPLLAVFALLEIMKDHAVLKKNRKGLYISLALTVVLAFFIYITPGTFTGFVSTNELYMLQNAAENGYIPAEEMTGILGNLAEVRGAMVSADALRSCFIILIGCALLWLHNAGKLGKTLTIAGIAILCLVDMWSVNKRYLNDAQFVPETTRTVAFRQSEADKFILKDTDPDYRVLNFAVDPFNENNTAYWHKSVGGYHAAKLRRYQELIDRHIRPEMQAAQNEIIAAGGVMDSVDASTFRVINMLNTRYFIFPSTQRENIPIRNPYAMGNAWFVDRVLYVANANEEIDALDYIDPTKTAVADNRFAEALHQNTDGDNALSTGSIRLINYEPNRLVYETDNPGDGVAVFSEIYYPDGWLVTVDGQDVALARVNYVLRALRIPAGQHTVEMHFDPPSLHVTEGIAYAGLSLLAIAALISLGIGVMKARKHTDCKR